MIPILNYTMQIGGSEWIWLIFLAVLLLFGPTKLPELARGLGKAMGEFQKGRAEIEREIRLATAATDTVKKPLPNTDLPKAIKPVQTISKAAEDMGLNVEGKTDDQIRKDIIDFLNRKDAQELHDASTQTTST